MPTRRTPMPSELLWNWRRAANRGTPIVSEGESDRPLFEVPVISMKELN